jgi:tricarballylate dehydrogenase
LLLEHAPRWLRGGNTRHSRNLRFAHEAPTPLSSGPYPAREFRSDLRRATHGTGDEALTELLVERSADAPDWLTGAGVHFQPVASGVLPPSRKTAFLLGGGKSMLNALYATAERIGVEIRYGCEVRELRLGPGGLERVLYRQGPDSGWIAPRAAIACCGGSQANRNWLRAHWGEAADGFINRGTPFATGELLECMLRQGALPVGDPRDAYLVAVDGRSPADDGGIVTRVRCMPAGIVVNRDGRRIGDEGGDTASTRYALWGQRLAHCPGQIAYLVLDSRGLAAAPPSLYPPIVAETLEGLAALLGIQSGPLAHTVARYNGAVRPPREGADPAGWHTVGLEPPKSCHALALADPPFAAYPMRPGITFTYRGVGVDAGMRVRREAGGTVPNLFAAGMIMAPNILPRGYISGLALTVGVVSGRIAGEEAARHARG